MPQGLTLRLTGDANDYAGKGLSGGRIIIKPSPEATFASDAEHHRGQRHWLRRDERGDLHQRRGRRALRRAKFRRDHRRRGHVATTRAST